MKGDVTLPVWAWIAFFGALVAIIVWFAFDNWRMDRQFREEMQAFWKSFHEADRERWDTYTKLILSSVNASDADDIDACDICAHERYEYDPADDVWHSPHEAEMPD